MLGSGCEGSYDYHPIAFRRHTQFGEGAKNWLKLSSDPKVTDKRVVEAVADVEHPVGPWLLRLLPTRIKAF